MLCTGHRLYAGLDSFADGCSVSEWSEEGRLSDEDSRLSDWDTDSESGEQPALEGAAEADAAVEGQHKAQDAGVQV